jgi:uncharacterized membrane protein
MARRVAVKDKSPVVQTENQPAAGPTVTSIARFEAEFFEGPLPPPQTLAEYDKICPGSASRILAMAEAQSQHRQELEKHVVVSNCRTQDRGPILGFILAAGVIVIGGYLILQGKELTGLAALVAALAAIVVPFIYGKRAQKEKLEEKRRELASEREWEYSRPHKSAHREQ